MEASIGFSRDNLITELKKRGYWDDVAASVVFLKGFACGSALSVTPELATANMDSAHSLARELNPEGKF